MKMTDINKMFTEIASKYINEGYIFCSSMAGHQGEVNKVDLVKGKKLIRVWLSSEMAGNWLDDNAFHGNKMVLRVGQWKYDYSPKYADLTVWTSDIDVIQEITFYEIDRNKWYVEDLEEAKRLQSMRHSRRYPYSYADYKDITSDKAQEIGVKYLKRVQGYQRVSKDAIRIKKYIGRRGHISYKLYYKSNYYVIA